MRLLLAEDDPKLLKSLKHIFETNKFVVDAVDNGKDALHYAFSDEYDGLILDIMMPASKPCSLSFSKIRTAEYGASSSH